MPLFTAVSAVLVATGRQPVLDAVLAAAAAVGTETNVVAGVAEVAAAWDEAAALFIGTDLAEQLADLGLPRRERVHLVGTEATELVRWSMVLGAATALLPEGADQLTAALTGVEEQPVPVIAVVGGCGGAGTSTVAVGLAQVSSRDTLLVDADTDGGGLDLVLGIETDPGWRWADLANARGHLGPLRGQLPRLEQVEVIAMSRTADPEREPSADAVGAVIRSGRRSHDLVVVDAGRGRCSISAEALRLADTILMVTPAEVRAVAATRSRTRSLAVERLRVAGLLVRPVVGSGLGPDDVAVAVGAPVWAEVPNDRGLAAGSLRGGPPNRTAGRRWRRACRSVLDRIDR